MAGPNVPEICDVFARLAERVTAAPEAPLDGFLLASLRRATEELRRYIPGLDLPPDAAAARLQLRAAESALMTDQPLIALIHALRGLATAPHHPRLYYVLASVCCHYGALEEAIRLLHHALWIHPGYRDAERDLERLLIYGDEHRQPLTEFDTSLVAEETDDEYDDDFDYTEYDDDEWFDSD